MIDGWWEGEVVAAAGDIPPRTSCWPPRERPGAHSCAEKRQTTRMMQTIQRLWCSVGVCLCVSRAARKGQAGAKNCTSRDVTVHTLVVDAEGRPAWTRSS